MNGLVCSSVVVGVTQATQPLEQRWLMKANSCVWCGLRTVFPLAEPACTLEGGILDLGSVWPNRLPMPGMWLFFYPKFPVPLPLNLLVRWWSHVLYEDISAWLTAGVLGFLMETTALPWLWPKLPQSGFPENTYMTFVTSFLFCCFRIKRGSVILR